MGKMFMLFLTYCLFTAGVSASAQVFLQQDPTEVLREQHFQSSADDEASEIARIGKWGKIKARHESFSIVIVTPLESTTDSGGVYVLSMDDNHITYRTLFSGLALRDMGLDRDKFMQDLQNPKTIIDCNTDGGTVVLHEVNIVFCGKNFRVRHK